MAYAIIVAGGSGTRMGAAEPKQYLKLDGVSILERTLRVFNASGLFNGLVLVLPPNDLAAKTAELRRCVNGGEFTLVGGGQNRQASVYNGLKALQPVAGADDIVCVHDAVRPFVTSHEIAACIEAAKRHGAAVLGAPVTETVKRCDDAGRVLETVPRENLWLAQTPQVAKFSLLWQAYTAAIQNNFCATDDAALLEAFGVPVFMVKGSRTNIKITDPTDLAMAKKLI